MHVCVLGYIYIAYLFIYLLIYLFIYVCLILIAFPLQQRLHERPSMLRYTYIACLFCSRRIRLSLTENFKPRGMRQCVFLLLFTDVSKQNVVLNFKVNRLEPNSLTLRITL